jgi:hypothetical protein
MRILQLATLGVAGLALLTGASAIAQSSNLLDQQGKQDQQDKFYGYVDLKTGQFHPTLAAEASPEATVAQKTLTGTINTVITTTIESTLPKGTTILCDVDVTTTFDGVIHTEVASAPATISGTKATCTVKLPYSWTGPSGGAASSYVYGGTYKVTATSVPSVTQPITDYNVLRQTTGNLTGATGLVIPASGTVTTFDFETVI